MANIFNKTPKVNGAGFSVDKAKLTFAGLQGTIGAITAGGTGLLVQNVQCQYQQQLSFLYDLTDPAAVYYVAGRAEGTLQIGKIVGDQSNMKLFYSTYGDVCATRQPATFSGLTGCSDQAGSGVIEIKDPVITSFGMTMNVNEGVINEQVQMRFTDMSL